MKIVTFEEFNKMPAGTIFAPWTPNVYKDEFEIKTDAGEEYEGERWLFNGTMPIVPIVNDTPLDIRGAKCGPVKSEMFHYDGATVDYEDDKYFAIMEEKDIRKMIEALEWALSGCAEEFDTEIPFEEE